MLRLVHLGGPAVFDDEDTASVRPYQRPTESDFQSDA
jgi:hypothetical protein